ncbi:hypothetical protein [Bacillus cereus]|uniref:hypothetical protein n=1 Tax=Bacillus cereus TaxID=1396 RepID=UPI003D97B7AF
MVKIDGDTFALNSHEWNGESYILEVQSNELYDITPIFELNVENDPIIVDYNVKAI